ncbi:monofunctional biosynthetic peptidoglycan transglycosylase [Jiulongibacter sp. NS-SX5]|uniref:monofunctional biosynthetic peptidoglycan transglycosylase n=1 Tax=Jiulongibacter sp. NS-SX5 TaxID=3463854 RepID=UPI0040580484
MDIASSKKKHKLVKTIFREILPKVVLWFFASTIGAVILFRFIPIPITLTMVDQWIRQGELHYDWEPIEDMADPMKIAVVAAEDQLFPEHNGFDMKAIKKALERNKNSTKKRGGSTISQQTAKNVFLWQGQSWLRKGLEVYFTGLIELIWGKKRILEVYLNVAEMGPGVFGAEAAANQYFGKKADALSTNQAARIAAVLPSPRKWRVVNSGSYVTKRTGHIQRQIRQLGGIGYLNSLNL